MFSLKNKKNFMKNAMSVVVFFGILHFRFALS